MNNTDQIFTDMNENFRYLHMGLPEDILRRKLSGDFKGALRLIDQRLADPKIPQAMKHSLTAQREIICRLPADYPFTREEALARVREHIPDFTEAEFDERVDAGKIGWICSENGVRYFIRFFETLCKTEPAFGVRAGVTLPGAESAGKSAGKETYQEYCIRRMKEEGSCSCRIRVRSTMRIKDEVFVPGMKVRAHLPIPAECPEQTDIVLEEISPAGGQAAPGDAPQRTVFWEKTLMENETFTVQYSYIRKAVYHDTDRLTPDPVQPDFFTQEEAPHIVFTPYIRELTEKLTEGVDSPLEKARRFYDFITKNMTYTFMPSYFVLDNIAENCARNFTGDCGVFALLFLTLCRCAGIPARWQSGMATEPAFCGCHDWAQFYIAPYGWLYADPSYGLAAVRAGKEERRQFYFGNLEPCRMAANHAFQAPFTEGKKFWRADPYDNQVGEIELENRGLRYDEYERDKQVLLCEDLK